MSNLESKPDNNSGVSGGIDASSSAFEPEILFNRPTKQRPPHEVLQYGITEAILDGETALFEVLPGVGKSRSITKIANGLKTPITILTNLQENYGQFEGWGEEDGEDVHQLPVSTDDCLTIQGSYPDDPTAQEAREAYRKGWPVSTIHREFDLPCEFGENTCSYRKKIDEIDPDGLDPLVGHYTQGYNTQYVNNRVVVIDENGFNHYVNEIKNPVEEADEFLDTLAESPLNRIPFKPDPEEIERTLEILEDEGLDPADHRDSVGEFHAKAPLTAYALLSAEEMENGWWVAELPGKRTAAFYGSPGKGSLHLFTPPDLFGAEAVIGLDATPCLSKWEAIIGSDFKHYRLFNDDQRNQYLCEQGYEFIQLNDYVWPVSGGSDNISKREAYLREIYRKHGERPDLITSKALLGRKDDNEGLEDRDLGHLWDRDMHYGNLRGRNKLEDSELLLVLGSPSRGDGDIQLPTALLGECAIPAEDQNENRITGYDLDYQSEIANDILETSRRGGVFQAVMRAGRKEATEATVYIATGMVPKWLDTEKAGERNSHSRLDACTNLWSDGMKQVIEALRGAEGMAPSEFYEQVNLCRDEAKKYRQTLQERNLVEKEGRTRGAKYYDNGLENLNIAGEVDLSLSGGFTLEGSIRRFPPKTESIMPRRDSPADPPLRYPDWMRDVQQRVDERRVDEQWKQIQRGGL